MANATEIIDELKGYPSCAHLSPPFMGRLLEMMNNRVVYMGSFETKTEGHNAATMRKYCANRDTLVLVYSYQEGCTLTGVIIQSFHENVCDQMFLSWRDKCHRNIVFTDSSLSVIEHIGGWV